MTSPRSVSFQEHLGLLTPPSSPSEQEIGPRYSRANGFQIISTTPTAIVRSRKEARCFIQEPRKPSPNCMPPLTARRSSSSRENFSKQFTHGAENAPPHLDGNCDRNLASGRSLESSIWSPQNVSRLTLHSVDRKETLPTLSNQGKTEPAQNRTNFALTKIVSSIISPCDSGLSDSETLPRSPDAWIIPLPVDESLPVSSLDSKDSSSYSVTQSHVNRRLRPSQRLSNLKTPTRAYRQTVDRFISSRKPLAACRDSLILSTPVAKLTSQERLFRRRTESSDPFGPVIRKRSLTAVNLQQHGGAHRTQSGSLRTVGVLGLRQEPLRNSNRQISHGAVWTVGGTAAVSNSGNRSLGGREGLLGSGTNAPFYTSKFLEGSTPGDNLETYEKRLALAFEVDLADRVLEIGSTALSHPPHHLGAKAFHHEGSGRRHPQSHGRTTWKDNVWIREGYVPVLEAPNLRDDFYCSILAYSHTTGYIAVGLADRVYLWSRALGVNYPPAKLYTGTTPAHYITSVAFSSAQGERGILAVGRGNGHVVLWSPCDKEPRFITVPFRSAAAYVSFRPMITRRPSHRQPSYMVDNEVLLVGDDCGLVAVYLVEWPSNRDRFLFDWHGAITLHAKICIHTQQICGISWSPAGDFFATGGNDNLCCLFEMRRILGAGYRRIPSRVVIRRDASGNKYLDITPIEPSGLVVAPENVKHQWRLNAAVKAIAFCPWQHGLLAAGGGSNDRCIHFYHTLSGACLATIDCAAQVTSLIWSTTRREIAATFGFAQPDHPFRIAVYAWPTCQQVVAIPWHDEMRALYAISYPGGPNMGRSTREGGAWGSRTAEEGCIVVAGSDGSIRFHEVWCEATSATGPHQGLLGGSDILESLHGIDKDWGETIR